jgi:DNA (cytosine-5)-methyltransferase 1
MGAKMETEGARTGGLTCAGLFAGIGGIELGLEEAGHESSLLCEVDEAALAVLDENFPSVPKHADITTLEALPEADLVAAGFPCQDLSQAGRTAGIAGAQSGLVDHVFRLLDQAEPGPRWLLLENVPFMLQLDRGEAMSHLVRKLGLRGWRWAYRVVDTRAFGLPQRRKRVILLASRDADPRPVLFGETAEPVERVLAPDSWCGFYWTEGLRGLGWAVDAVPTLKGGSTIGIPSPPAIWIRETDELVTPEIRDAERLQGFPADWTAAAVEDPRRRNGPRWKLTGNAVSVPVARWVGERLLTDEMWEEPCEPRRRTGSWPAAAWGEGASAFEVQISMWPRIDAYTPLGDFLEFEAPSLTRRAAAGFLDRARRGSLRFEAGFLEAIAKHIAAIDVDSAQAA